MIMPMLSASPRTTAATVLYSYPCSILLLTLSLRIAAFAGAAGWSHCFDYQVGQYLEHLAAHTYLLGFPSMREVRTALRCCCPVSGF